jgi:hypothetical protein
MTIPARDNARPVKIRPREVHAWLNNLPYMDLGRTARLASHQLRVMNRQAIAPATRTEILGQFLAAYHRLGAAGAGTPAEARLVRPLLRRLCQDLGFGYKIVVHDLAGARSRLLESRHLSAALLGAIHVLGLQLLHYYRGYQRTPRALWSECLALYRHARKTGRHTFSAQLPGSGKVELDADFRLIGLLRLSNPYRLPHGMVTALENYLGLHIQLAALETGAPAQDGGSHLLLSGGDGSDSSLTVNVTALLEQLQRDIDALKRHRQARAVGLPASVPAAVLQRTLEQLRRDWAVSPSRRNEREAVQAQVELVSGLDAVYCVLNGGRCFDRRLFVGRDTDEVIDLGRRPLPEEPPKPQPPTVSLCQTLNRSSDGVALSQCGDVALRPRVGQLVAVRRTQGAPHRGWVLAVCRWLAENETGSGHDIGLQYLTREARAVVVRCPAASGNDYQPTLASRQRRGAQPVITLITHSGRLVPGQQVSVYDRGRHYRVHCVELVESGAGFERLVCLPA